METEHFNKLTPAEHERLSLLFGECGEVIQAISKIMRHGYESGWNGNNNRADLEKEISHVQNAIEMLVNLWRCVKRYNYYRTGTKENHDSSMASSSDVIFSEFFRIDIDGSRIFGNLQAY